MCVCVCVGGGGLCVTCVWRDKILRFINTLIVITGIMILSYTDRIDVDFTT